MPIRFSSCAGFFLAAVSSSPIARLAIAVAMCALSAAAQERPAAQKPIAPDPFPTWTLSTICQSADICLHLIYQDYNLALEEQQKVRRNLGNVEARTKTCTLENANAAKVSYREAVRSLTELDALTKAQHENYQCFVTYNKKGAEIARTNGLKQDCLPGNAETEWQRDLKQEDQTLSDLSTDVVLTALLYKEASDCLDRLNPVKSPLERGNVPPSIAKSKVTGIVTTGRDSTASVLPPSVSRSALAAPAPAETPPTPPPAKSGGDLPPTVVSSPGGDNGPIAIFRRMCHELNGKLESEKDAYYKRMMDPRGMDECTFSPNGADHSEPGTTDGVQLELMQSFKTTDTPDQWSGYPLKMPSSVAGYAAPIHGVQIGRVVTASVSWKQLKMRLRVSVSVLCAGRSSSGPDCLANGQDYTQQTFQKTAAAVQYYANAVALNMDAADVTKWPPEPDSPRPDYDPVL